MKPQGGAFPLNLRNTSRRGRAVPQRPRVSCLRRSWVLEDTKQNFNHQAHYRDDASTGGAVNIVSQNWQVSWAPPVSLRVWRSSCINCEQALSFLIYKPGLPPKIRYTYLKMSAIFPLENMKELYYVGIHLVYRCTTQRR